MEVGEVDVLTEEVVAGDCGFKFVAVFLVWVGLFRGGLFVRLNGWL